MASQFDLLLTEKSLKESKKMSQKDPLRRKEKNIYRTQLMSIVSQNVIGRNQRFSSPFGERKVVYCDWIASGKSLAFVEDFIRKEVLPFYANTHTTCSISGIQTSRMREDARKIVENAVNGTTDDVVLFTGTGCTGAVHKLIGILNFQKPPVVFVGPYEHHSNYLPWKEIAVKLIRIRLNDKGEVDLLHLDKELKKYQKCGRTLVGSFSAGSNITGLMTNDLEVTSLLHKRNALSFWDYACTGPYAKIDMNPKGQSEPLSQKDAIFLSPHKFMGGPETPGVLVAKRKLFRNEVPIGCGGGTVLYVSRNAHCYLDKIEDREEGGTPSIVGVIRTGLVFKLKEDITHQAIQRRDQLLTRFAMSRWSKLKNLVLLGNLDAPRLPIFSFLIFHPQSSLFIHHNFVCTLLNDLFGIQARGGCACAGPYAVDLLEISEDTAVRIETLLKDNEIIKPGFCRLSLSYILTDKEANFIVEAVSLLVQHAWKLLPYYRFKNQDGSWHLNELTFSRNYSNDLDGKFKVTESWLPEVSKNTDIGLLQDYEVTDGSEDLLKVAEQIFEDAESGIKTVSVEYYDLDKESEEMRWFLLPHEAKDYMINKKKQIIKKLSFLPKVKE